MPELLRGHLISVPKGTACVHMEHTGLRKVTRDIVTTVQFMPTANRLMPEFALGTPLVVYETAAGQARWVPADAVTLLDAESVHVFRPGRKRTGANTYGRGTYTVVYKPSCSCGWRGGNTDRAGANSQFREHLLDRARGHDSDQG